MFGGVLVSVVLPPWKLRSMQTEALRRNAVMRIRSGYRLVTDAAKAGGGTLPQFATSGWLFNAAYAKRLDTDTTFFLQRAEGNPSVVGKRATDFARPSSTWVLRARLSSSDADWAACFLDGSCRVVSDAEWRKLATPPP
jgi:hypothetical protein